MITKTSSSRTAITSAMMAMVRVFMVAPFWGAVSGLISPHTIDPNARQQPLRRVICRDELAQ